GLCDGTDKGEESGPRYRCSHVAASPPAGKLSISGIAERPTVRNNSTRPTQRDKAMRFMVIVKATKSSEAGVLPSQELLTAMGKYNEELTKVGVMLAGEGLHPSSKGARVRFEGEKRPVIDGPFAETKELVAGFWLWKCGSLQEAIEWVKHCP